MYFQVNYKDLIKNWKNKVVNEYKNENLDLEAERIYRTPSVLSDQCPHTKKPYIETMTRTYGKQ